MSKVSKSLRLIQGASLLALFPLASQMAFANGIAVTGDTVTIAASAGGFNQAKNLTATAGTIPNTDNVPPASITSDLTFTFDVAAATGKTITAGTYTFNAGMFIDQDSTMRRLEMSVPGVSLTFDASGNITSGSIAAGSNVKVSGRSSDGSATAVVTLTNTLLTITDATFEITAGAQITEIEMSPSIILQDLTTTFNANASYDYAVFLNQLSGADLTFGLTNGTTFFGCPGSNPMLLTSQTNFTGASALVGRMGVGQAAGGSPTAYSGACTVVGDGGGGGGTTPSELTIAEAEEASQAAAAAVTTLSENSTPAEKQVVADQIAQLTANITASIASIAEEIAASPTTAVIGGQLNSLVASSVGLYADALDKGLTLPLSTLTTNVKNYQSIFNAYNARSERSGLVITDEALATIQELALNSTRSLGSIFSAIRRLGLVVRTLSDGSISEITVDTLLADITSINDAFQDAISAALSVPGIGVNVGMYDELKSASQTGAELVLGSLGSSMGLSISYTTDVEAQSLLASNTTLLTRLVDTIGINLGESTEVNATTTDAALVAEGLTGSFVSALSANITQFIKADDLQLDTGSGAKTVSSTLMTALGADTLAVDSITGAINYTNGGSMSVVFLKSVMPAPAVFPSGTHLLSDGSTLINDGNLLYILVSGSNSITDFAGAIQSAGNGDFSTSITDSGVIKLTETASNIIFSSTISTSALGAATATSDTTFEAPTGNPADSAYRFVVQYDDGTRQEILPAVSDAAFYTSVGNAGFQVSTDRRTGIVTIGTFSFRPDFFQTPLTVADVTYHTANTDSSGVAYRAVDANGDGVTDYQVLTATGVQTLYTLP